MNILFLDKKKCFFDYSYPFLFINHIYFYILKKGNEINCIFKVDIIIVNQLIQTALNYTVKSTELITYS